jgi:hypothetical protein
MKTLLTILLLITCITINAQKYATGTFENVRLNENPQNEFSTMGAWTSINTPFILNITESRISLDNKSKSVFNLSPLIKTTTDKDGEGDETTTFYYTATDEEGIKCNIHIRLWTKYSNLQIYAYYSNLIVLFDGRVNKYNK